MRGALAARRSAALIAARRPGLWALSPAPVRIFTPLGQGEWLEADVRGELGPRFLGLPTGFWVGVLGLVVAAGVLRAILREGRAIARISASLEAFAVEGAPQPLRVGGSPEVAALARRAAEMQRQLAALLGERNTMLGAIAHDIKTYVQRLKLRLDLLDDPAQIEKAQCDLDAMNRFVDDALLLAVHSRPLESAEVFDLGDLVAHECEAARLAGGDVSFVRDGAGPWRLRGDAAGLSRAIANIVGNALRYGGRARVALHRRAAAIEVVVDDCGPGIPGGRTRDRVRALPSRRSLAQPRDRRLRPRPRRGARRRPPTRRRDLGRRRPRRRRPVHRSPCRLPFESRRATRYPRRA